MSKFETKTIDEASAEERRNYATSFLGIPTTDISDSDVLAKIRAAQDSDLIFVRTDGTPADQAGVAPAIVAGVSVTSGGLVGGPGRDDPKVQLTLHAEERDGVVDTAHKAVGVNGYVWLLKRGVSLQVPLRVYYALEAAERDNITHTKDGDVIISKVKSTPYNVELMPSGAEIAAWEARVNGVEMPA